MNRTSYGIYRGIRGGIRGGVVIGLLAMAVGSTLFDVSGFHFSTTAQVVIGSLGVLTGAILGAREPV
jgi:hypothetical protein